jgi:hypothetical protein
MLQPQPDSRKAGGAGARGQAPTVRPRGLAPKVEAPHKLTQALSEEPEEDEGKKGSALAEEEDED